MTPRVPKPAEASALEPLGLMAPLDAIPPTACAPDSPQNDAHC
jgi:hypothetical protein